MGNRFLELERIGVDGNILDICDVEIIDKVLRLPPGRWRFPESYDVPMEIMIIGEKVELKKEPAITREDNWAHRSVGMRCSTCMFCAEKKHPVGRCKRHAPTLDGFPVIFMTDWCGDHKLDETKVIVNDKSTS